MPVAVAGEVEVGKGAKVGKGARAEVVIDDEVGVGTGTDDAAAERDREAASAGTEAAVAEDDTARRVVIVEEMNVPDTAVLGGATHAAKVAAPDTRKRVLLGSQNPP